MSGMQATIKGGSHNRTGEDNYNTPEMQSDYE